VQIKWFAVPVVGWDHYEYALDGHMTVGSVRRKDGETSYEAFFCDGEKTVSGSADSPEAAGEIVEEAANK
jgi:hypothetical protein